MLDQTSPGAAALGAAVPPAPSRTARLARALSRCHGDPGWGSAALALLLSLPVPVVMALQSRVLITYTYHDVFIPLDAAWRTLQGQWPHTDFYSPLGLAYFWLHGAAAWLWGMNGLVVIRANFLALPFVVLPALLLGWRRLQAFAAVTLIVVLTVLVTSPVFMDGPERLIAHLANYNRIGAGLCALVCLWALCPPRRASPAWDAAEAVALGLLLLALLALKVTLFALAFATVLAGCCSVRGFWRSAVLAGLVACAGALALEALHPGLWFGYLGDIRHAGAANTQVFRKFDTPRALFANLLLFGLVGALGAATWWAMPRQRWAVACIAAVACACGLVATQNFGSFSVPLIALVAILAQRLGAGAGDGEAAPLAFAGAAAVALAVAPFLVAQVSGTLYLAALDPRSGATLAEGRSDVLSDVVWVTSSYVNTYVPPDFTPQEAVRWQVAPTVFLASAMLDDGLDLLVRHGLAGRRIANLSFSNPFPATLRAPPPRGVALWWDEGRTYTAAKLTPEQAFGDADVVMVPDYWYNYGIVASMLGAVGDRLRQDFTPLRSRYWTAWVRR